jgi:hypothetical protein
MVNRDELDTTVTRMEQHLAQSSNPSIQILLQAYHQLKSRFRIDLVDERDYLLSLVVPSCLSNTLLNKRQPTCQKHNHMANATA